MDIVDSTTPGQPATPGAEEKAPLVKLRSDLDMYPGTPSLEGYPTYVIHDLYSHKFTNIGHTEYEILKRWHLDDAELIVEDILETTTLYVNVEDVEFLSDYLSRNELAVMETEEQRNRITKRLDKKQPFSPLKIMKLLMFVIRLARPDRFLTNTYWMVKFAFSRTFWWIMLVVLSAGIFLVIRDWSVFVAQVKTIFSLEGAAFIIIALVIAKIFHEFGHAYMCKHLGLAVPKFGLRLMIIIPFFFTDTNESWKLQSRKQRFMIGAGGILSESILAICSMFLWGILDDGPARNTCFYLFVTSWVSSLAINITPFLKWDGYYMFSDLIGVQNLQMRGFGLGKWQLREWLFKWEDEIPLKLSPTMHKVVVFYAYGAWIKRTLIFIGIALLVYSKVFKVLGIFLLLLQLNFFVGKPLFTEIAVWCKNFDKMNFNRHSVTTLLVFSAIIASLVVPWQNSIRIPATVAPRIQAVLFTPESAQIAEVNIKKNDNVKKGQLLVRFKNTNLEYDIRLAKSDVDILRNSLDRFGDQTMRESRSVIQKQLQASIERTSGLIDTYRKLSISAPFDGEIVSQSQILKPGNWFETDSPLAIISDKSSLEIYAYVPEKDFTRIQQQGEAVFYPEDPKIEPIAATIVEVDQSETRSLKHPMLSVNEGGSIEVTTDRDGLRPTKAVYRVRLKMQPEDIERIKFEIRGTLHMTGKKRSIATDVFRKAVSVIIRESGF